MKSRVTSGKDDKIRLTAVIYYYFAMLISLLVFFGGANLATHGFLRATTNHEASTTTCLPSPAPKVTDPANISDAEGHCRDADQHVQIRQGTFQVAQGIVMVMVAGFVFSWHFRRIRSLELHAF